MKDIRKAFADQQTKREKKKGKKFAKRARTKDSLHALSKLAAKVDGVYRIVAQPPLLIPFREIPRGEDGDETWTAAQVELGEYLDSVPDHLEALLERFTLVDGAIKVVGVGSVGTRCWILLLQGRDDADPFFLQIKEATRSVLEDHLPPSRYPHHGQRVVEGQRLMQAVSDSFLGWMKGQDTGDHYYVRQLKDMKGSPDLEKATPNSMRRFAKLCGWTLARAHARSGDAEAITGYLGSGDVFDKALADFSVAYADQNERDFAAFTAAIDSGRIEAHE